MGQRFSNNASGLLSVPMVIEATTDTITLQTGYGSLFPQIDGANGDFFDITIQNPAGDMEIVRVFHHDAGDVLGSSDYPSERGREGTPPTAFDGGSRVEMRLTAAALDSWVQKSGDIMGGELDFNLNNARDVNIVGSSTATELTLAGNTFLTGTFSGTLETTSDIDAIGSISSDSSISGEASLRTGAGGSSVITAAPSQGTINVGAGIPLGTSGYSLSDAFALKFDLFASTVGLYDINNSRFITKKDGSHQYTISHAADEVVRTLPPASGGLEANNLSTGGGLERVLTVSDSLPKDGFLFGMETSNPAAQANNIEIAPGKAADSTGAVIMELASALTKRINENWAEDGGAGSGGFPSTLTLDPSTWYRVFIIRATDGTIDAGFDEVGNDAANALLPDASSTSGKTFNLYRQIAWVRTDAVSSITPYYQIGDDFRLNEAVGGTYGVATTATHTETIIAPPDEKVLARFLVTGIGIPSGSNNYSSNCRVWPTRVPDVPVTQSNATQQFRRHNEASIANGQFYMLPMDANSQVKAKVSVQYSVLYWLWNSIGWQDPRGKY